jgi:hypothetical protein
MRVCKIHGETEFRNESRTAARYRCCKCLYEAMRRRRLKAKMAAVDYLGGACSLCGYAKCIKALEFHHKDPEQKDFGLSDSFRSGSLEKVKPELDKCVLLCANCHREEHMRLQLD